MTSAIAEPPLEQDHSHLQRRFVLAEVRRLRRRQRRARRTSPPARSRASARRRRARPSGATGEKTRARASTSAGEARPSTRRLGAILDWLEDVGYAGGDRRGRPSRRPRRPRPRPSRCCIDEAALDSAAQAHPARAAAPAAQPRRRRGGDRTPFPARRRSPASTPRSTAAIRSSSDTFALPRALLRRGRAPLRLPRPVLRIHHRGTLRTIAPQIAREDVIVAHLGNGASMCAIENGRSIASTMGFTALDGLPMGTRCGQLDPGVAALPDGREEDERAADLRSSLQGVRPQGHVGRLAGHARARGLRQPARRARPSTISSRRIRRELAGLAATVDGVDGIVFTGGIGEHSCAHPRGRPHRHGMDGHRSSTTTPTRAARRSSARRTSPTAVFVIPTDEERMIAEHTRRRQHRQRPARSRADS